MGLEALLNETLGLLMRRTGKTQADLAAAIGVSRGQVSQRLNPEGKATWRLDELPPVADLFGLTVCELISGYTAIANAERLPPAKGSEGQTRI